MSYDAGEMHCTHYGAPVDPESLARGACHFCKTAVARAAEPSVDHGVAEILSALGVEGAAAAHGGVVQTTTTVQSSTSTSYVVGGKTYASLDEMPPDVRARVEQQMAKLAAMGIAAGKR